MKIFLKLTISNFSNFFMVLRKILYGQNICVIFFTNGIVIKIFKIFELVQKLHENKNKSDKALLML